MVTSVPYLRIIKAYRIWNQIEGRFDMDGFFKFLECRSLFKNNCGPEAAAQMTEKSVQRMNMLLGPHARTIIKAYHLTRK